MKCNNCGTDNKDGVKFCENCGTSLKTELVPIDDAAVTVNSGTDVIPKEDEKKPAPYKEPKSKKGLLAAVAAVLVLIIAVIIFASNPSSGGYELGGHSYFVASKDGVSFDVYYNGDRIGKYEVDAGAAATEITQGVDGSVYLVDTGKSTAYIHPDGVEILSKDIVKAWFADDGETFVYTCPGSDGRTTELYIYNIEEQSSRVVEYDILAGTVAVSPDASVILYNKAGFEWTELYLYKDGSSEKIAEDLFPISVDNSADCIYAYSKENSVYHIDSDYYKSKLKENYSSCFLLNDDRTQIMFSSDGRVYFSNGGKDPVMLFDNQSDFFCLFYEIGMENSPEIVTDLSDLGSNIYYCGGRYYYLAANKKDCTVLTKDGAENFFVSEDFEYAYYISPEDRAIYRTVLDGDFGRELLASDATSFVVDADGTVYYINGRSELHSIADGKDYPISERVDSVQLSGDGEVFFVTEGSLCVVDGKNSADTVTESHIYFDCTANYAVYADAGYTDGENIYISDGDDDFDELTGASEIGIGVVADIAL